MKCKCVFYSCLFFWLQININDNFPLVVSCVQIHLSLTAGKMIHRLCVQVFTYSLYDVKPELGRVSHCNNILHPRS